MASTKSGASKSTLPFEKGGAPSVPPPAGETGRPTGYSATSTRCPGGDRLTFHVTEAVFTQDGDCCGKDDWQTLTVRVEDGGGGKFLALQSERWSLDRDQVPWLVEKLLWLLEGEEDLF